jgi:[ribosomal protein S18]-alanine N-acetyltransferase
MDDTDDRASPPSRAARAEKAASEMDVRRLTPADEDEARACARIMATSEPWITLGRDFDASLDLVRDPAREVYVAATEAGEIVGFVILVLRGAFVGYMQTIAIREDWRGRGLGSRLIAFAEARIFRESPNVFICVSDFNTRARVLYERLGYVTIGELRDYIAPGHSEWLLRKSIGSLAHWRPPDA